MFGCLILAFTNNLFGAVTGVLLCGGAFSMIIPLAVERIGDRFPYFRIGMFNGIFSIALVGGGLAPASLGLFAYLFGINVVMILPAVGSVMVLVLVLLIFLEAHLHAARGRRARRRVWRRLVDLALPPTLALPQAKLRCLCS